jgi:C1A family cysteine protease
VYDQGKLGSCTANAIACAYEFGLLKQRLVDFGPSRLFIYYNERVKEGTVASDSGAMIRDGPRVARTGVVCIPGSAEEPLGGHAVLAVGYDDASGRFLVRNSWGAGWGQHGYFTIPYGYLTERDLSSDF